MRTRKPQNQEATCEPGSIEQQLDMCETGSLRGEEQERRTLDHPNFAMDMSEEDREGDEMSGDEHSGGLQGEEPDLASQPHISAGIPGDRTRVDIEEEKEEAKHVPDEPPGDSNLTDEPSVGTPRPEDEAA